MLFACEECHRLYDVTALRPGQRVRCSCGHVGEVPEPAPVQAEMLRCASCGGDLHPERDTCPFCQATVDRDGDHVGDPCPGCFARVAVGDRYCSHCGLEQVADAVVQAVSDRGCPRCELDLTLVDAGDVRWHACPACAGIWLDDDTLDRLVAKKRDEARDLASPKATLSRKRRVPRATRYGRCPACERYMTPHWFARASGVLVDRCAAHGFWFDAGELDEVTAWVGGGGLDAAGERRERDNTRRIRAARRARAARKERERRAHSTDGIGLLLTGLGAILRN